MSLSNLDYAANTYLAVTLLPSSPFLQDPPSLAALHPAIAHVGQVGALQDTQLFSVPRHAWEGAKDEVLGAMNGRDGVVRVDVQELKTRAKRDEL